MTHLNDTMSTSLLTTHKKNAHLTKEERVMIATLKSQGLSNRAIGRQLGVNHQTINNESSTVVRSANFVVKNLMVRFTNILTTSIVMKLVRPHILNITAILVVVAYIILQSNFYD